MHRSARDSSEENWRYALVGGIASMLFTVGLSWQSGLGTELALGMALVAGTIAGYLAARGTADADSDSAGIRAGLVGALPGLWVVVEMMLFAGTGRQPLWVTLVGASTVALLFAVALFVLAGLAGFLGAAVGRRLAVRSGRRSRPVARL
jgi:hypothetical protein